MKKIVLTAAIALLFPVFLFAKDVYVQGHYRDTNGDGIKDTYVPGYHRTSPNSTKADNYSYPGNYNPNTGRTSTWNQKNHNNSGVYNSKKYNKYDD